MNYLITGGAGFIGSNLSNYLLGKGHNVTVIDNLSTGNKNNLEESEKLVFINGSVTDVQLMESLISTSNFDYIFHLAAVASVVDSIERPIDTHEINFSSVMYLFELIKKYQPTLKRLVFASSASVYGNESELPKYEDSRINPLTPYAVDKYAAEKLLLNGYHLYGVPTSVVRFFNVYGPKQNPNSIYSGVISILVERFKLVNNTKKDFKLYGDGSQTRDFVYIEDVIQALLLVSDHNETIGECFNVGTSIGTSLNDVISILTEVFGRTIDITYEKERKGDIKHSRASINKLITLGFSPAFSVKKGLTQLVDYEIKKNVIS